jgi:hypothetical protein
MRLLKCDLFNLEIASLAMTRLFYLGAVAGFDEADDSTMHKNSM